jgi:hypothetical protein
MPAWCTFRDAARKERLAREAADAAQAIAAEKPQAPQFQNSPLKVFGEHDHATVAQMRRSATSSPASCAPMAISVTRNSVASLPTRSRSAFPALASTSAAGTWLSVSIRRLTRSTTALAQGRDAGVPRSAWLCRRFDGRRRHDHRRRREPAGAPLALLDRPRRRPAVRPVRHTESRLYAKALAAPIRTCWPANMTGWGLLSRAPAC